MLINLGRQEKEAEETNKTNERKTNKKTYLRNNCLNYKLSKYTKRAWQSGENNMTMCKRLTSKVIAKVDSKQKDGKIIYIPYKY